MLELLSVTCEHSQAHEFTRSEPLHCFLPSFALLLFLATSEVCVNAHPAYTDVQVRRHEPPPAGVAEGQQ